MKAYIGTKLINAKPMTRAEYNVFRGWELPANENGADEGFLVEYVGPGQKANTSEYSGYVSWSPKEVFDEAYKECEAPQQRMVIEHDELIERHNKLVLFLNEKAENSKLTGKQIALMYTQRYLMECYAEILSQRIELATEDQ